MIILDYGTLPGPEEIVGACVGPYKIGNVHTMSAIVEAVNQGIDSHLEAVFWTGAIGVYGHFNIAIEPGSMPVLLRRLVEMYYAGNDEAGNDASAILGTLGFEWI